MTRKIVLLMIVLAVGAGALAVSIMTQPEEQSNANAEADTVLAKGQEQDQDQEQVVSSETGFLNYDIIIGDKDAPVEIIEYAAISCSHCADFHEDVYPELKKKYLDTGKAKLVYRNFIFNNPFDVFAASISRCVPEEKFLSTLETYFQYQNVWNNLPELRRILEEDGKENALKYAQDEVIKIGKLAGVSEAQAAKCFDNEAVTKYLFKIRQEAVVKYEVESTPTLIVNGKKLDNNDMASLVKAIESGLK
ncbi:MAG: DsbA family protein [Emcibacter sp.]|nr:DsbA family protein [Emcibacter sp.]